MSSKEKKKTHPTPVKGNKQFTAYWHKFITSVTDRDNFQTFHLKNLEVLCLLYTEYDKLTQIIQEEGFTIYSHGRYGEQYKTRPEVEIRQKILAEVRQYSRLLGIVLVKDANIPDDKDNEDWNE